MIIYSQECYAIASSPPSSPDQAAYRTGYPTTDHLLATTLLIEARVDFNQSLWVGALDSEKAFDTVELAALWDVLHQLGGGDCYIWLLKKAYRGQAGTVTAAAESRQFSMTRGVKPDSALLFISVMEICFRGLQSRWNALNIRKTGQYYGFAVDSATDALTNSHFAGDVLLLAQS